MKQQDREYLRSLYLFEHLTPEETEDALDSLSACTHDYPTGSIIFSPEHFSPRLILVLSGKVSVVRGCEGKEVLLNTLSAGDLFGAAAMFGVCEHYPTTVRARGQVRVALIDEVALEALFARFPKTAISHIRFLSDRIRFLNDKIHSLTGRSVESKLSKFILEAYGKDALHGLNMSRLASSLDIGRASLYRLLQKLSDEGIITFEGGTITVMNLKQLERLAKQ